MHASHHFYDHAINFNQPELIVEQVSNIIDSY